MDNIPVLVHEREYCCAGRLNSPSKGNSVFIFLSFFLHNRFYWRLLCQIMWSISATIFSCVFCFLSLCLHTLPRFHLECVYQNIFVCNNRLNSSYPFSSYLLSIWKCCNPQMLSESKQLTICSNNYRACEQNIP